MVVYASDKLELNRPFADVLEPIRRLAYKDIRKAYYEVLKDQKRYLIERNEKIHESLDIAIKELDKYYGR